MNRSDRYKVKLENQEMEILGDIRTIPEVNVTITGDGRMNMSFDEYHRIADWVHEELKRKRKVRYK